MPSQIKTAHEHCHSNDNTDDEIADFSESPAWKLQSIQENPPIVQTLGENEEVERVHHAAVADPPFPTDSNKLAAGNGQGHHSGILICTVRLPRGAGRLILVRRSKLYAREIGRKRLST